MRIRHASLLLGVFLIVPVFTHAQNVPPAVSCEIFIYPNSIPKGDTATVYWTSSASTGGTIFGLGSVGPYGSRVVAPENSFTYYGVFVGPSGLAYCNATLTVLPPVAPPPATTTPQSCTQDGLTLPHGNSHLFYLFRHSPSCLSFSQLRTCDNGALTGSSIYSFATCTAATSTNATTTPPAIIMTILEMLEALLQALEDL